MKKAMLLIMIIFCLAAAPAFGAILSLDAAGSNVDLVVSGLDPSSSYIVTSFFADVYYDSTLTLNDVTFGSYLGDPADILQTYTDWLDFGMDVFLDETSFISNNALYGLQQGLSSFTLATLFFSDTVDLSNFYIDDTLSSAGIDSAPVPEPATMLLLGTGLAGLAGFGRRKFFKKQA